MPRKYVRTTQRQSWTSEQLKSALTAIKGGSSMRKAGREFGIPESTLRDKLKVADNGDLAPALGRKPVFTTDQEQEISDHVIKLANRFYGLTPIELRRLAFDFAEKNHIKHSFNREQGVAGYDWLSLFTKRNPDVKLREPDNTSINRIRAFSREEVDLFYSNLKKVFDKHSYPPHRIFNMDETGISNVQKKSAKIYAKKGQKRVGCATSVERGKTISVVCSFNAAGSYVPPMMIYPRQRMAAHFQIGGPIGAAYHCSNNGGDYVKPTANDPVLLICDNHGSHISLEAYFFCRENFITVVSIPPHTSHRLQPLDVTFFGPLKGSLSREYGYFMVQNAHRKITTADVASLLNKAYVKVATMQNAVSGFKSAGIMPFDPDKFSDEDFAAAEEFQQPVVMDDGESSFTTGTCSVASPIASTSTSFTAGTCSVGSPIASTSTNCPESAAAIPFKDVAKIPNYISKNQKDTNKKMHSEILTSTPVKKSLEVRKKQKEEKNLQKEARQKKKEAKQKEILAKLSIRSDKKLSKLVKKKSNRPHKKRKKVSTLFETDESDVSLNEMCDDDEFDDIGVTVIGDKDNDKCIFCDEFGRDNEQWFRCVVCGFWAHSECSGFDSPDDYECDLCIKKAKKKNEK